MEIILLLILLYFCRNAFAGATEKDVDDFIMYDYISDGELDGDMLDN